MNEVPNVTSTGINDSAKMIWQAIQATDSFTKYATVGRHHGTPGRYWHGSVNQIVNNLWPALEDRYLTERDQSDAIKFTLNRFLKYNNAVVCTRDGGRVKPSLWFVSAHWPELTVTPGPRPQDDTPVVSDEAATASPTTVGTSGVTPLDVFNLHRPQSPPPAAVVSNITATTDVVAEPEEKSEEAMTTDTTPVFQEPEVVNPVEDDEETVEHECRFGGCTEKFKGVHWRATHEMRHGFRVNADGSATSFDVNSPAPDEEEVQNLITQVCQGNEPMNQSQIVEAVRSLNPRVGAPTAKIVLQILIDDGWFESLTRREGIKGQIRRFKYLGEPKRGKKAKKPLAEAVEETVDKLIETKANDVTSGFMATAVAALNGSIDPDRLERYQDLFQDLLADLREIERLKAHIERLDAENARLDTENAELRRQRDDALAKTDVSEELIRVTADRDELQGKLNTLKQIFN